MRRFCSSRRHRWGRSCLEEERKSKEEEGDPCVGLSFKEKGGGGCVRRPQGSVGGGAGRGWGPKLLGDDGCEEAGARGTRCDRGARA